MFVKSDINNSQIVFYFCLFFISGIVVNSFWRASWIYLPVFLISIIVLFIFWKDKKIIIFVFLIAFCLGITRSFLALSYEPLLPEQEITGTVISDVKQSEKISSFIVESDNHKVSVITEKYFDISKCDQVKIKGDVQRIKGDFYGFMAKDGVFFTFFFPQIEVIEKKQCQSLIANFKNKSEQAINSNFSLPESSILEAVILGNKHKIPSSWQDKLSFAGVRHITAVSGMHVAVIGIIFLNVFLFLGFNKKRSVIASFLFVVLFIIMIGAHPSAIRAGIMGLIAMLAKYFGRMNVSFRSLVLAAFIMLLFNPFLLRYDIGFQLSFAAVSGIILFSLFFQDLFKFLPKLIKEITAISFSAYIFTFPIIGYYFQNVSLVFPITNLLILPVLYGLMFLGIIFVFFSLFSGFLASVVSIPLWIILKYILSVVDFFSSLSWATAETTFLILLIYVFLLKFLFKEKKKWQEVQDMKYSL